MRASDWLIEKCDSERYFFNNLYWANKVDCYRKMIMKSEYLSKEGVGAGSNLFDNFCTTVLKDIVKIGINLEKKSGCHSHILLNRCDNQSIFNRDIYIMSHINSFLCIRFRKKVAKYKTFPFCYFYYFLVMPIGEITFHR